MSAGIEWVTVSHSALYFAEVAHINYVRRMVYSAHVVQNRKGSLFGAGPLQEAI